MHTKILEELGLTNIESKIYLELLKLGPSTVWPVIKKTRLHKSTVYNSLERLMEKGLVSFIIKHKKRHYEAAEPLTLMTELEKKEKEMNQTKDHLQKLIPSLEKIKGLNQKQEAQIFMGKEGLKTAYEKVLKERKTVYGHFSGKFRKYLPIYFKQWLKKREKLGIRVKFIANESSRKERDKLGEVPKAERRFLQVDHDNYNSIVICGDKVVLVIWGEQPVVIFIQSKDIAKNQLIYFKQLWKVSKP